MPALNRTVTTLLFAVGGLTCTITSRADVLVLEPSITLDQRFDDNFFLNPVSDTSLSATRLVGDLGLSRESEAFSIKGLARLDTLLTSDSDVGDTNLNSNRIAILEARKLNQRSRLGLRFDYTLDTPSRDIAVDISDTQSLAQESDLLVSQTLNSNVEREEFSLEPTLEYDITRRLQFDAGLTLTKVTHATPDARDAIFQRFLDTLPRDENGDLEEEPLSFNEVTIDDVGVFSPNGELDDYNEIELLLGLRFKLSPRSTVFTTATVSRFASDITPVSSVPFDLLQPDVNEPQIVRLPRFESVDITSRIVIGYERFLTETLQFAIDGGFYTSSSGFSNATIPDEFTEDFGDLVAELSAPDTNTNGQIASIGLVYDAGRTRYSAKFAIDIQPSSAGAQVETNELTGRLEHTLSPRLDFTFNARAFEPDRLGAREDDLFSRRFISAEPAIRWKYSRNWTVSAAYRYRRQKARVDPESADSNALLFAIKYTHPSEVRDRAATSGL